MKPMPKSANSGSTCTARWTRTGHYRVHVKCQRDISERFTGRESEADEINLNLVLARLQLRPGDFAAPKAEIGMNLPRFAARDEDGRRRGRVRLRDEAGDAVVEPCNTPPSNN